MAQAQHPFDITWDDVRLARKKSWRFRGVVLGLLLLAVCGVLWTVTVAVPVTVTETVTKSVRRLPITASSKSETLCAKLNRWSGQTVLRLGPKTRALCSD